MKTNWVIAAVAGAALLASACVARPAAPLANTSWTLVTLAGQPILAETTVTLAFESAGSAGGKDGCNTYSGSYTLSGAQLSFGQMASTMMACPEPIMNQAAAYLKAVGQTAGYQIDGGTLTLRDAGGNALATFARQP
jgi:putative lipoprotein